MNGKHIDFWRNNIRFFISPSIASSAAKAREKCEINWKIYFQSFYDERIIFNVILSCFSESET